MIGLRQVRKVESGNRSTCRSIRSFPRLAPDRDLKAGRGLLIDIMLIPQLLVAAVVLRGMWTPLLLYAARKLHKPPSKMEMVCARHPQ
jgi:hypothetical protein